jgi:hypothetical protein
MRVCCGGAKIVTDDAPYAAAESAARLSNNPVALTHALRHRSDIARLNHQPEIALTQALEATALSCDLGPARALDLANALRLVALAHEALGETRSAMGFWREAEALYQSLGVLAGAEECAAHLGR